MIELDNTTKIPNINHPIINIDKSVFWALLLGIAIGLGLSSSGESKRIEIQLKGSY